MENAANKVNISSTTENILKILWLITSLVLTSVNYNGMSFSSINNFISFLYFIANLIGSFIGNVVFGIILGLIVLGIVWAIKKDLNKAFEASIITAIAINILMSGLF